MYIQKRSLLCELLANCCECFSNYEIFFKNDVCLLSLKWGTDFKRSSLFITASQNYLRILGVSSSLFHCYSSIFISSLNSFFQSRQPVLGTPIRKTAAVLCPMTELLFKTSLLSSISCKSSRNTKEETCTSQVKATLVSTCLLSLSGSSRQVRLCSPCSKVRSKK